MYSTKVEAVCRGIETELQLCIQESSDKLVHEALLKALDGGGATGPLDDLDASSIELTALRNAIYMAEEIGLFTATTRDLLESARVVSNIRNLALQKQWDSVYEITSDVLSKGRQASSDAAFQEADFLHSAIEEQRVISGYMNALASGAATYNIEKVIVEEEETIPAENRRLSLLSSDKPAQIFQIVCSHCVATRNHGLCSTLQ